MNLSDLGEMIADFAPLLGKLLPIPGAGIAGSLIASAFGTKNEPSAIASAIKADPNAALKLAEIENTNKTALESQLIGAETNRIEQVNKTMRAEAAANDPYVRRWRPTIGYVVASQFALLGLAVFAGTIGALFVSDVAKTTAIFTGLAGLVGSMTVIIASEAAILGIGIKQRSNDKAIAAGHAPGAGLLDVIKAKVG